MLRRVVIAAALMLPASAWALDDMQRVGNWLVRTQADRFGDANMTVAMRAANGWTFALKCEGKKMLFVVSGGPQTVPKDSRYAVKFRVDGGEISEMLALATEDKIIGMLPDKSALARIVTGKEAAFRFTNKSTEFDVIVPLDGAQRAMRPVFAACRS